MAGKRTRLWAVCVGVLGGVAAGNGALGNVRAAGITGISGLEGLRGLAKNNDAEATAASPRAEENRLSVAELRPGDVLATRWGDEKRNGTPGYWNHLAIVGTDGRRVVEAQRSADGAISTPINSFSARYSEVVVFRFFDSETARRAAAFAENRVAVETVPAILRAANDGKGEEREEKRGEWVERGDFNDKVGVRSGPRYAWSASLAPTLRVDAATENCVSLVRRAFLAASAVDYRWKTPDDLARWDKSGDFAKIGRF